MYGPHHAEVSSPSDTSYLAPYQQLPAEILANIFTCFPNEGLTNLALVNRTYQVEAERLLYRAIAFHRSDRGRLALCLDTLSRANSHHRLAWIRSFSINLRVKPDLLKSLSRTLPAMTLLKDLRLRLSSKRYITWALYQTFRRCTFSLTTLGINFDLAIALAIGGWLPQHSLFLNVLGIYATPLWDPEPGKLAIFADMFRNIPVENRLRICGVASLSRVAHIVWCFPLLLTPGGLSSPWTAQPLQEFADVKCNRGQRSGTIVQFHVYLNTLSDGPILRHVIGSIAERFPDVENLSIYVNDPEIHQYMASMASVLALLPLEDLYIVFPPNMASRRRFKWQGCRGSLARAWTTESATLRFVHFPDAVTVYRNADTWTEINIDECEKLKEEMLQVQLELDTV